jgi:hypothetical protein
MTIVDAQAGQTFPTASAEGTPPSQLVLSAAPTVNELNARLAAKEYRVGRASFAALGFGFNEGTHPGLGRVALGLKGRLLNTDRIRLGAMAELFLPSPSEDDFAGSASTAVLPRLIGSAKMHERLWGYADVGYDYDFETAELRRFAWTAGVSVPFERVSIDVGAGGSEYDVPIRWTPTVAHGAATAVFPATTLTVRGDNQLDDALVDVLVGARIRPAERLLIGGGVTISAVGNELRPDALFTLGAEVRF